MHHNHLYRFRSTHALLDGYQELENQQIYFCPPEGLNDPLEGFKHIFWRGDHIVWRNLLRHYLFNLMQATSIACVMGQDFNSTMCAPLVHQTEHDLPQAPIRDVHAAASREFFKDPAPEKLVVALSSRKGDIRRDELLFYLRLIHPLAAKSVLAALAERRLVLMQNARELSALIETMGENLDKLLRAHEQEADLSSVFFSASEYLTSQLALMNEFRHPATDDRRPWLFIAHDFTDYYVSSLERLLYPDWHVACFVADPTNSAMWGGYGDSHRGACLKFKANVDDQGARSLDLYRANSWSGGKDGMVAHHAYVPHRFEQVRYTSDFPEVDFFESIATLPRSKLSGFWFAGPNGERSTTAKRMLSEDEGWRQEYWRKFANSFSTKSDEWAHEKETRLVLHSSLQKFDDTASRQLRYRFSDLAGIVFGMKTANEDKLHILRIIERKCAAEGRKDFEFYQARFSERTKKIELAPLSILKL
ncbi:DUF2971 domain-containing protein [Paraburkholderia nemoris]|uniref:DUF2971 domain-containing protein n=1 Tax=Paraburkholderia nemoris TaxID=2793076 RepID=UPI0038BCE7EE